MIPCTTGGKQGIKRYEDIVAKRTAKGLKSDALYITKIQGRPTVLLLQDMFPIREEYIKNQYIRGGQPVKIADPREMEAIKKSALHVLTLIRRGVKFTDKQPDAVKLEQIMLAEIGEENPCE